ncbi:hypothetical protein LVJ82_01430 [Vitreoscilla massiliensis]|uniref:DUF4369 domain-containing protein n=1 Tax=Vitreoscilla massiliensis TaxID=1689272 RepID=A0ABY4E1L5_9NEIS|nr:hypothetical protein [Vitreoscilla massiliensis]UOO89677.1 hypothetical protein LVJ82_01430 [Vitreoscilla massiliensis]
MKKLGILLGLISIVASADVVLYGQVKKGQAETVFDSTQTSAAGLQDYGSRISIRFANGTKCEIAPLEDTTGAQFVLIETHPQLAYKQVTGPFKFYFSSNHPYPKNQQFSSEETKRLVDANIKKRNAKIAEAVAMNRKTQSCDELFGWIQKAKINSIQ